jgi:hypothetical protein
MLSLFLHISFLGASLMSSASVSPGPFGFVSERQLVKRAGSCNVDNLLRLMRTPSTIVETSVTVVTSTVDASISNKRDAKNPFCSR